MHTAAADMPVLAFSVHLYVKGLQRLRMQVEQLQGVQELLSAVAGDAKIPY